MRIKFLIILLILSFSIFSDSKKACRINTIIEIKNYFKNEYFKQLETKPSFVYVRTMKIGDIKRNVYKVKTEIVIGFGRLDIAKTYYSNVWIVIGKDSLNLSTYKVKKVRIIKVTSFIEKT